MRSTSTAIQLPWPWQFQQATPQRSVPSTTALPGQRKPQPAGSTSPWASTHWRAAVQRSWGEVPTAADVTGGVVGGVVTGTTLRTVVVVVGRGFTVVDVVDVEVEVVEVDVDVEVEELVGVG